MNAKELMQAARFYIKNGYPLLVTGSPGIGKTDILKKACQLEGYDLIVSHPVLNDPTDHKGFPVITATVEMLRAIAKIMLLSVDKRSMMRKSRDNAENLANMVDNIKEYAKFIPFQELRSLVEAKKPTVFFLDDIGQAPSLVQASCMRLLLDKMIGEYKLPDYISFVAATNRRQDRSAVQGILEAVKGRFYSIIPLEPEVDGWTEWAIEHKMPPVLIAFLNFRPTLLVAEKRNADIIKTEDPRSIAMLGQMLNKKMPPTIEIEMISSTVGNSFATEFIAFRRMYTDLPNIEDIVKNPKGITINDDPGVRYAVSVALAYRTGGKNIKKIKQFMERLPSEYQILYLTMAKKYYKTINANPTYVGWLAKLTPEIS